MPAKAKVAMIVTAQRSLFHAVVPSVAAGNSEGRHDSQLHRERQTGGGRRSAAGAKPVSRSSHAKGLRCQACAYLSEVVTQIQLGGSRTDSLVRILHAQPGSPVSANGFGQFPGGEHRKAILAALALLDP